MKIALCFERADTNTGPARFASFLASSLVEEGFDVACASLTSSEGKRSYHGFSSVKKWFLPKGFLLFSFLPKGGFYQHNFVLASTLRKCVRIFKPDVVISSCVFAGGNILRKIKALKVLYVHVPLDFNLYPRTSLSRICLTPILQLHHSALKNINKIVCNSEYIKRLSSKFWENCVSNNRLAVIYPCIDWNKFQRNSSRRRRIACVGRIGRNKGLDLVINAFLKADVEASELVISGSVSPVHQDSFKYFFDLKRRLKNLDDNRIKTVVNPSDSKIIDIYTTSRCFANYNPGEHFGISVVEAMASGTPPIVADGGGQKETVAHGLTGFRVRMKHPEDEMAKYMKLLLTDDKLFNRMSSTARISSRQFDKSIFTKKWTKLLYELRS